MFPAQWYKIAGRTEPCLSLSTPMISPGKNASRANGAKGDARWARPKRPDASTILQKGETLAERIVWSHPRKNVSSATAAASPERTAAGTRRIEGKKSRPLKKSRDTPVRGSSVAAQKSAVSRSARLSALQRRPYFSRGSFLIAHHA